MQDRSQRLQINGHSSIKDVSCLPGRPLACQ